MDFVASVVHWVAALTQTMEDGRRQMVGLLLPSDFLGRPNRDRAAYDVTATTYLQLCCFRRLPFQQMLSSTPHVSQRLLEMTLDELDAAREWMLLLGRKTAREKIASFLSIIARRDAAQHTPPEMHVLSAVFALLTTSSFTRCWHQHDSTSPISCSRRFLIGRGGDRH